MAMTTVGNFLNKSKKADMINSLNWIAIGCTREVYRLYLRGVDSDINGKLAIVKEAEGT